MKEKKIQEEFSQDFSKKIPVKISEKTKPEISEKEKKMRFKVYAN